MDISTARQKIMAMTRFTEAYQKHYNQHPALREAYCLDAQFPDMLGDIDANDRFCGRTDFLPIGFFPQELMLGYYCDEKYMHEYFKDVPLSENDNLHLKELLEFWKTENTNYKVRAAYPPDMQAVLNSDEWMDEPGIAFPLYRMSGSHLDYDKLLKLGINGLRKQIDHHKQQGGKRDQILYQAMHMALDVFVDACHYYADQAMQLAALPQKTGRDKELREMAKILRVIASEKPDNMREAMQLVLLWAILSGSFNFGRMDEYLGDFYANDIDNGHLSEAEAQTLIDNFWEMIDARKTIFDGRVIVGGRGRRNPKNADRFALAAIQATRNIKAVLPQLTLRFYEGQNPQLLDMAYEAIAEGRTYPMLYSDDVNIPAVEKAFDVSREEAEQYLPFGCGEYVLYHRSFGTPSGVINMLKALEITIHNGTEPITGQKMGLALGDMSSFKSFDELLAAYKQQIEHYVGHLARQEDLEYKISGQEAAFLYFSMLYDDCLERGQAVFSGGIRYLGGTLESYGNTNTTDSLLAIKKLVYQEKKIAPEKLQQMLICNFEGFEKERQMLLNVAKYGNDDTEADQMAQDIHNHICLVTRKQREQTDLHSYLIVVINNHANTILGRHTHASADGRLQGESMANGNNPAPGRDTTGLTAMLNSLSKLDCSIHAGAVQNMKFSNEMFRNNGTQVRALLNTYFEQGGAQAMITVVGREDLKNAMRQPSLYSNLIVRVGGFSARFVELDHDVQLEILNRTLY